MSSRQRVARRHAWRVGAAFGEGVRAALAGRLVSAAVVLLVCWLGALPGAVDSIMVAKLVDEERRFLDAGGKVLFVENREAGVPVTACEQLAEVSGVEGSAALTRLAEPATLSAARGGDITVFAVTSGIYPLLGAHTSPYWEGLVSASFAGRLGLMDGDWIQLEASPGTRGDWIPREPLRVAVVDTEILSDEFAGIFLPVVVAGGATADTCVVAAEPAALPELRTALPAALAGRGGQPVVRDRLFTGEFAADYSASYRQRPLQWSWVATGSLLGLVWILVRWVRRAEDALYAMMSADRITRLLLRTTEWALLAGLGGMWALALGTIGATAASAPFPLALSYVGRHVGATLLVATAITLLSQLHRPRSLLADMKDR